jgi:hypothetical protein
MACSDLLLGFFVLPIIILQVPFCDVFNYIWTMDDKKANLVATPSNYHHIKKCIFIKKGRGARQKIRYFVICLHLSFNSEFEFNCPRTHFLREMHKFYL